MAASLPRTGAVVETSSSTMAVSLTVMSLVGKFEDRKLRVTDSDEIWMGGGTVALLDWFRQRCVAAVGSSGSESSGASAGSD